MSVATLPSTVRLVRTLAVAIHDVEPRSFHRIREVRSWLEARGVERLTLLVIPASELHPIGARGPALIDWLHGRTARGDTIAQLGLAHRTACRPPWPRSLVAGSGSGRCVVTYDQLGG